MNNVVDFIWSHVPWIFSTIIVIAIGITGLKIERYNNFTHEADQVIARYGGLTPKAVSILNRDSNDKVNNTEQNQATSDFASHDYISNQEFTVTTLKRENSKIVPGAKTSDFNGNGDLANKKLNANAIYDTNRNGHFVKVDGVYKYATSDELNGKYKSKTRYAYGYYEKNPNGKLVNVNGSYVPVDSDKLNAEQRKGDRYIWVNQLNETGVNWQKDPNGHYIRQGNDYVWASTHDLDTKFKGETRYGWKGNYHINKRTGRYEYNDEKSDNSKYNGKNGDKYDDDHFVTTFYQTDDSGRVLYDDKGQPMISQQVPNQTTVYGGKIVYVVWVNLKFFHTFNVTLPTVHSVRSQVRQGSLY